MSNEILRGFEIVNGLGVSVMKFKPTYWGAKQCAASVKWLRDRHPNKGYEMRALVSIPRPEPDESKTTEEQLAEARVANGEYDIIEKEPNVDAGQ
jgi:hypothetical protein